MTVCLGNQLLVAVIFGVLLLIEAKHKEANGRRQIGVLPMIIDCSDQMRQGFAPPTSNFSQPIPEFILKAEARLVASKDNRALQDRRFRALGNRGFHACLPREQVILPPGAGNMVARIAA